MLTDMTDTEQVTLFRIEDELVAKGVMTKENASEYAKVCIERARAYAAHIKAMTVPTYLWVWAADMAAASQKPVVKCHHNYLPWLETFMVVRYGEAVEHWPMTLTQDDIKRARDWKAGARVPNVVWA